MASNQELQVKKKRELEQKEEATMPARVFVPDADIYETNDALMVLMEMPGVDKGDVDILVEDGAESAGSDRFLEVRGNAVIALDWYVERINGARIVTADDPHFI